MGSQSQRFRLDDFRCVALSDGSLNYPIGHLFANAAKAEVEEALHRHGQPIDYLATPCTCLYVDTGRHRVLMDLGAGALAPSTGGLRGSMAAAGIAPSEVDTVIITHAHAAHVGGVLDEEGRPICPNARHYVSRAEWDFWMSELAFARASVRHVAIARRVLEPIRDRMSLVEAESEIVPGVGVIPAPGHTLGHMAVAVSSGERELLYTSDTAFHPLHLERPTWRPIYDIAPEQAATSKRRIFDRAAESGALVLGAHFPPFPGLGHIAKRGQGWQWQPIQLSQMNARRA
jgi:glyoxylase-like metal-dependent hydrolase (beta-lactamase superfamily II)